MAFLKKDENGEVNVSLKDYIATLAVIVAVFFGIWNSSSQYKQGQLDLAKQLRQEFRSDLDKEATERLKADLELAKELNKLDEKVDNHESRVSKIEGGGFK